jgi:KaiC/GvpD/RAD55 family RecA-like ATPase
VIDFVRAGIEQDDRVWYFADVNEPQHVLDLLRGAGINVDRALHRGQLSVFTAESSYLTELPFSPERMLESVARGGRRGARSWLQRYPFPGRDGVGQPQRAGCGAA